MSPAVLEGFRLSPQQKYQWLLQKEQSHQAYCVQGAILIEGEIKIDVLKQAFNRVVERQEILRTTFKCLPGMEIPIQEIGDNATHINGFTDISLGEKESQIQDFFDALASVNFNLEEGPLIDVSLAKLSPEKQLLFVSLSPLIGDGLTLKNLAAELSRSYTACLHEYPLEDEPLQYADIAEWQHELLQSEDTEIGRDYWRQQDISSLLDLRLPLELQSQEDSEFKPKFFKFSLHSDWLEKLETLAPTAEERDRLSSFLLTCWKILLWRLTDQSDLAIALGCNGRQYEELESAMGCFAKYLPLRVHLENTWKFSHVLQHTCTQQTEAFQWQDSFSWEQAIAGTETAITSPFCPFSFEFELTPTWEIIGSPSFSLYKQYTCIDRFKVKLVCARKSDVLDLELHYDANLFSEEAIAQLAAQFQVLVQSAIEEPNASIDELEMLPEGDRQQLLVEFNQTSVPIPEHCIHQLFETQVERTPNNIAIQFENQQLTYRELNEKANQLAHYLQGRGVGRETIVGVCVNRSPELLIGILGILKAGGTYLPLDPTYPPERLNFILSDSQASFVLSQQSLINGNLLQTNEQKVTATITYLDTDWQTITGESGENPISRVTPENLAYIIYTSGSTGKPKGTMIPHRGLVNYLNWCTQAYDIKDGCGSPVHSSIGFDATITSLFSPLLVGRQVLLLPEAEEIEALSTILRSQQNFSLVKITPAHLELLGQFLPHQDANGQTRAFIIGGEALLAKTASFWQDHAPNTRLINEYGPTETVVGCCVYEVPPATSEVELQNQPQVGTVPIGKAIANTQLYVLDRYFQPVPFGVIGELYIGGLGVARGYLNRPELTAEKFVPHPFSNEPGHRLYKTGDLARYLPDGNLEFLGRIDHQVKIRGFRIELGEIEAVLSQHPEVRQVVVLCREDDPEDKRLVAYVAASSPLEPAKFIEELRQFLQQQLPDYMIPSAFVILESLPLTPNGKIDRQTLPAPKLQMQTYVAPRTAAEEIVAEIWREVLNLERVGIGNNFFDLGGHSLRATQVISRLQQAFQIELPLRSLFTAPTVESMVDLIAQHWGDRDVVEEIAQTLQEVEQLSDSEVQTMLGERETNEINLEV